MVISTSCLLQLFQLPDLLFDSFPVATLQPAMQDIPFGNEHRHTGVGIHAFSTEPGDFLFKFPCCLHGFTSDSQQSGQAILGKPSPQWDSSLHIFSNSLHLKVNVSIGDSQAPTHARIIGQTGSLLQFRQTLVVGVTGMVSAPLLA